MPPHEPNRRTAQRGGTEASPTVDFSAHFKASFRTLWGIAAGLVGDRALAEDVVQEAAAIALRKFDQFEPGTNFTAWMAKMVRFVAMNEIRKARKHDPSGFDPAIAGASAAGVALGTDMGDQAAEHDSDHVRIDGRIADELSKISDVARACLMLRTLDAMSYGQIAELLDIPEGTAMSHVHRARLQLREALKEDRQATPMQEEGIDQ